MDKGVQEYIEGQRPLQKGILKKARKAILKALPRAREEMKWGVPTYAGGKFYLVALKDHVNIGFAVKGLSKEEQSLFEGKGKTMRHVKIFSPKDFDGKRLAGLIRIVDRKAECKSC